MFSSKITPSQMLGKHNHFVTTAKSFHPAISENGQRSVPGNVK